MNEHDGNPGFILRAVDNLRTVLAEIGWNSELDNESSGFVVNFEPPYIPLAHAFAAVSEESHLFVLYLNFGVAAAADRRDETVKFMTLANWDLLSGNFEMDYEEGLLRFRSSVCFRGTELSDALIRNAILLAMNAVERYADLAIDVMARGKTAEQAFKEARPSEG